MSELFRAAIYILQTLGQLYIFIVVLRFILQMVRADFYNPISQFVVRATHPLLMPMRKIVPGFGGLDLAALVLALYMLLTSAVLALAGIAPLALVFNILLWSIISLAAIFFKIFFFALIIGVILSWVAPHSHNPAAALVRQLSEPALLPFRRLLPDLGGIDISPIFALLALNLIDNFVLEAAARQTGLVGQLRALVSPFL